MRILVTGGCGFVGANFVRYVLEKRPDWDVTIFDLLTYSGNQENMADHERNARLRVIHGDVANRDQVRQALAGVQAVVNFAAETHVDRSMMDARPFMRTNVTGTQTLLDAAVQEGVERFIQISTDEVYGPRGPVEGPATEGSPLRPVHPYAASKAAADCLALGYCERHGLPVIITRSPNCYGPRQFPEKLIPLMILNALINEPLPVFGDGLQVRDWIHVEDHARALLTVLEEGRPGEVYHLSANCPRANLDIVRTILRLMGRPESLVCHIKDRPGHQRRYAIALGKLRDELGWSPAINFEDGMASTIQWYVENRTWWQRVRSGAYREALPLPPREKTPIAGAVAASLSLSPG